MSASIIVVSSRLLAFDAELRMSLRLVAVGPDAFTSARIDRYDELSP